MEKETRLAVISASEGEGVIGLADALSIISETVTHHDGEITFVAIIPSGEAQVLRVVPNSMMKV